MPTWVRNDTGTLPSATDVNLTGTVELGNATVPGDFDADAVNSVRIQVTIGILSGTFATGTGADVHDIPFTVDLTLDGDGTSVASIDDTDAALTDGDIGPGTFYQCRYGVDTLVDRLFQVC